MSHLIGHCYLLIGCIAGERDCGLDDDVLVGKLRAIFFDFTGGFHFHIHEGKLTGFGDNAEGDAVASGDGFGEEFFGVGSVARAAKFFGDAEGGRVAESVA